MRYDSACAGHPLLVFTACVLAACALPAFSADAIFGRRVYSSHARTYEEIWTLDVNRRHIAALTSSPRRHAQPVCSADSPRIWFLSGAFGDDSNTELWSFDPRTSTEQVVAAFTGNIVRLLGGTESQAFFVATEKTTKGPVLALHRWDGKLHKIAMINPALSDPVALAPDAKGLAFQQSNGETDMMNAAGASGRILAHCAGPVWSKDMRKVACVAGKAVRVLDVATGIEVAHTAFQERSSLPQVVDVSRDAARLLVKTVGASQNSTSPQSDYFALDVATKRWIFIGPGQSAVFTPENKVLLVTPRDLDAVGKRKDWVSQLLLIDPATRTQIAIAAGESSNTEPCLCAAAYK